MSACFCDDKLQWETAESEAGIFHDEIQLVVGLDTVRTGLLYTYVTIGLSK